MSALAAVAALLVLATAALGAPPCDSPQARAFDFWIGDWTIEQRILRADGGWLELPARTSVRTTLDGCALIEHWEGTVQFFWESMAEPQSMRGLSVRSFDETTGAWRIHWMDTRTPSFGEPYVGGFRDGRGEFLRATETPQGPGRNRITFSEITPSSVRWELAVSNDRDGDWTAVWIMEMSRRDEP